MSDVTQTYVTASGYYKENQVTYFVEACSCVGGNDLPNIEQLNIARRFSAL